MPYQSSESISKQLTIVIGLTVVGFMAFGLALSFYRNALFEQTLENVRLQNTELRDSITVGYLDLEYFRSAQYKDKYAKENLGLVRPGEKTLIITEDINVVSLPLSGEEMTNEEEQEAAYRELLQQMPVYEHWKLFLFHRKKMEELRREL